jgi:hypothetical protein
MPLIAKHFKTGSPGHPKRLCIEEIGVCFVESYHIFTSTCCLNKEKEKKVEFQKDETVIKLKQRRP